MRVAIIEDVKDELDTDEITEKLENLGKSISDFDTEISSIGNNILNLNLKSIMRLEFGNLVDRVNYLRTDV